MVHEALTRLADSDTPGDALELSRLANIVSQIQSSNALLVDTLGIPAMADKDRKEEGAEDDTTYTVEVVHTDAKQVKSD